MEEYRHYRKGETRPGSIVVKLYSEDGRTRGFVRSVAEGDEDDTVHPTEQLTPEQALRIAENKREDGQAPVFVELAEGVRWNSDWGRLS